MITIEPTIKIYDDEGNLSKAYDKAVDKMIDKTYDIDLEQFDFDEVANGKSKELDNLVVKLCKESGLGSKDIYTMLLDRFEAEYDVPVDFVVYLGKDWEDDFEESKKSIKESEENFVYYIAVYDEDGNCRGYLQNESWRITQDIDKAMHFKRDMDAREVILKATKRAFNDDELYIEGMYLNESKESTRKSIRESKNSSILDDEFYDLIEQGYIYDEDENGRNMSYGEYMAVSDDLWEVLADELKDYRDFPSAYDVYNEIMDNTSDDAKMFMGVSDDDYFYFEINEDENTYSFSGEVPTILEKLFKKFLKETDFERV